MIAWIAVLGTVGLLLSAFFSGSEIGFYRMSRIRLVLDARHGDRIARGLIWLSNRPVMFVATALVGNNLANYLVSFSVVLGTHYFFSGEAVWAEMAAPLLLAPFLFVYGELLPKQVFLQAPNRMIRRCGPALIFFLFLFSPISVLVGGIHRLLGGILGENSEKILLRLARQELQGVFEEGHAVGILRPVQQQLAQSIFSLNNRPIGRPLVTLRDYPRAKSDMASEEVLRLASRFRAASIPVEDAVCPGNWLGYLRVIDLMLYRGGGLPELRPLPTVSCQQKHLEVLVQMEKVSAALARVVDGQNKTIGWIAGSTLREPLFRKRGKR